MVKWPRNTQDVDSEAAQVNEEKNGQLVTMFQPVVQEFQQMIEEDPELYMGFRQMFDQVPDDPKYDVDPLGEPQVGSFIE